MLLAFIVLYSPGKIKTPFGINEIAINLFVPGRKSSYKMLI